MQTPSCSDCLVNWLAYLYNGIYINIKLDKVQQTLLLASQIESWLTNNLLPFSKFTIGIIFLIAGKVPVMWLSFSLTALNYGQRRTVCCLRQ